MKRHRFQLHNGSTADADLDAAAWVLRRRQGLTRTEEERFEAWMARGNHAEIYGQMLETDDLLDGLRRAEPHAAPETAEPVRVRRFPVEWAALAAIAAAIAVAIALRWNAKPGASAYSRSAATAVGDLRKLNLPDGSVVQLNTDSLVDIRYTASERRVRLERGEAFFTATKDAARPFWVEAGGVSVRAIGTAFNVHYSGSSVEVVVAEGKVRVDRLAGDGAAESPARASAQPVRSGALCGALVAAGEEATVPLAALPLAPVSAVPQVAICVANLSPGGLANALAWQQHRLEFSDAPLSEVVAEFNRYNRHKLRIADPALATHRFGGAFTPTDGPAFIELLAENFGVVAENQGDVTVLRGR